MRATADSPRELFTLEVENFDDPAGPVVPLLVREGDNIEALARIFAARHQLDAQATGELALAIVEHAKSIGCVRPLFVLQVRRRATDTHNTVHSP